MKTKHLKIAIILATLLGVVACQKFERQNFLYYSITPAILKA